MLKISFKVADVYLYSIILLPLWWLLGFDFIVYHIAALYFLFKYPRFLVPDNSVKVLFLMVPVSLIVGLLVSLISLGYEGFRYLAALNNISIYVLGYVYFSVGRGLVVCGEIKLVNVLRTFFYIGALYLFLAFFLAYFVISSNGAILQVPTLLGLLTPPAPGLLGQYQNVILVSSNWFLGDFQPRLFILAQFATGTALVGAVCGFLGAAYLYESNRSRSIVLLYFFLMFVGVSLTLSRATMAGYFLGLLVLIIFYFPRRLFPALLPVAVLVVVAAVPFVLDIYEAALESRQGSTDTRFFSYLLSIDLVLSENILTGIGVKPRYEFMIIPVGSHSSFIGIFVRGGILALLLVVLLFIILPFLLMWRLFLSRRGFSVEAFYIGGYLACLPFLFFQDVDAYPPLMVLLSTMLMVLCVKAEFLSCDRELRGK